MSRCWLLVALIPVGFVGVGALGLAQKPANPPANPENITAALKLTQASAAEYEFLVGNDKKPLELQREPVLKWSNPEEGEVHGNVFVWTREGRPLVVGCLFKWFSPMTLMAHELHSLAEEPLAGKFHGDPVWKTSAAAVTFVDVPRAPAPAATEAQRLLQLKHLAKEFSATGKYRKNPNDVDLRLLPQPIYRYAAPMQDILIGGVFAFVRATDPDVILLIEARGKDAASARWQFAAARMHSVAELRVQHQKQQVWEAPPILWKDQAERHEREYTTFRFQAIPDFLKEAAAKPKP